MKVGDTVWAIDVWFYNKHFTAKKVTISRTEDELPVAFWYYIEDEHGATTVCLRDDLFKTLKETQDYLLKEEKVRHKSELDRILNLNEL